MCDNPNHFDVSQSREVGLVLAVHSERSFALHEREAWTVLLAAQRFLQGEGWDVVIPVNAFSGNGWAEVASSLENAVQAKHAELKAIDAENRRETERQRRAARLVNRATHELVPDAVGAGQGE